MCVNEVGGVRPEGGDERRWVWSWGEGEWERYGLENENISFFLLSQKKKIRKKKNMKKALSFCSLRLNTQKVP